MQKKKLEQKWNFSLLLHFLHKVPQSISEFLRNLTGKLPYINLGVCYMHSMLGEKKCLNLFKKEKSYLYHDQYKTMT